MKIIFLVIYSILFLINLVNSFSIDYSILVEKFGYKPDSVVIDLRNKGISKIENKTFDRFNSLETLYLDGNCLEKLEFEFSSLANLSEIWFESNHIFSVSKLIFTYLKNLKLVCFSDNPISSLFPGQIVSLCKNCGIITKQKCKRTLKEHTGQVFSLVELKDQKSFASASADKTIRIWNHNGINSIKQLIGHNDSVYSIAVPYSISNRLASSSYDSTVRIWNTAAGSSALQPSQELKILTGHTDSVRCLAFLPDDTLASGSGDESIRIWNINTGESIKKLVGHEYLVLSLTIVQNRALVSGSYKEIRIWNTTSGETTQKLNGHTSYVWSLVELSGNRLASGSVDGTIKIWSLTSFLTIQTLTVSGSNPHVYSLLDLKNGKLAAGYSDSVIRIWDLTKANVARSLMSENNSSVNCLLLLPGISNNDNENNKLAGGYEDGIEGWLAGGYEDGQIRIWLI